MHALKMLVIGTAMMCTATQFAAESKQEGLQASDWRFGPDAQFVWTPDAVSQLSRQLEQPWAPHVSTERPRGAGVELYARVAPAVVVVRTDLGHGTGFIVSADGHILTNHHVISQGLRHDNQRSASYGLVHLGRLKADGGMELRAEPVRAWLLKVDPSVDLALLKLEAVPAGFQLHALQFADIAPKPGSNATIIGHPASGLLWTLRSGQVASIGRMPADLVDFVMMQLATSQADRQRLSEELKAIDSRRIVLTSVGANPGDSGGPVVDDNGRVIAVTFAVPADPSRAKFSYHVHPDEVRQFMKAVPTTAMVLVPDPWEVGPRVELRDLDGDRTPDVLMAGTDGPEMLLFDLDNDTPATALKDIPGLVRNHRWDFELALRLVRTEPTSAAFYDRDNDRAVDLVHVVKDDDHAKNTSFTRLGANRWRVDQNVTLTFPSAGHFKDARLAQRMRAMLQPRK
jgi:S1-C subfamily serine protease